MPKFSYQGIGIKGVQVAFPTKRREVNSFADLFGEDYTSKFSTNTGIKATYEIKPNQTASDLAYVAAKELIENTGIDPNEVGALIFLTQTADYRKPATAFVLQKRLGIKKDCAVFDVTLGCSAFVYGLQIACSMIASSDIDNALVLIGETPSSYSSKKDKTISMMFSDVGAAVLLSKSAQADDRINIELQSDGYRYKTIILPAGGMRNPSPTHDAVITEDGSERTLYDTYMNGMDVFMFAISDVMRNLKAYLKDSNKSIHDYDCFFLHQANNLITEQFCKKLKCDNDKVPISIENFGNTGGASIPVTMCQEFSDSSPRVIKALSCAFGIGLSWGIAEFGIDTNAVFPIVYTDECYNEGIMGLEDIT